IQPWGCGLWGEVDHVLSQLAVAEITGRTPIVYWGRGAYPAPGYDNAWEAYFEPVSAADMTHVERAELSFAPAGWTSRNLRRTAAETGRPLDERLSSLFALATTENVLVSDCHTRLLDILPFAPASHWLARSAPEEAYRRLSATYLRPTPQLLAE